MTGSLRLFSIIRGGQSGTLPFFLNELLTGQHLANSGEDQLKKSPCMYPAAEEMISHLFYFGTYHKSRQGRRWRRLLGNNLSTLFSPGGGHQDQRWWIWKNSKLWDRQPLRISMISGLAEICYDSKVTWSYRCWAPQRWDGGWGRVGPSCHPGARRRALCL